MSNHEEGRPLTRREIRMRQMQEQGLLSETEAPTASEATAETVESKKYTSDLSYLREAKARAEQLLEEAEPSNTEIPLVRQRLQSQVRRPKQFDSPFLSRAEEQEDHEVRPFFDEVPEPPTQPFSLEDLKEINADTVAAPPKAATRPAADEDLDTISIPAHHLRQAAKAAAQAEKAERALKDALAEQNKKQDFTFPDIQPIDSERSIFDDQEKWAASNQEASPLPDALGKQTEQPKPAQREEFKDTFSGLIDDVISGEEVSTQSNTSALILPSLPESDVVGTLGATGELFVTGSLELPKTLSETGGHSSQFDSILNESDEDLDIFSEFETTKMDIAPKPATNAVSALEADLTGKTMPVTQSDGKKPLVYALIGGGLILTLGLAALVILGTGIFK